MGVNVVDNAGASLWRPEYHGKGVEVSAVFITVLTVSLLVYFLPLAGVALHSDVHWIFRIQVAELDITDKIPLGLQLFAGKPSGQIAGCIAYYEAFGRANCLDVLTFRWLAQIAGASNDGWLMAYLMLNCATSTMLFFVLRCIGLGSWLAGLAVLGFVLAPIEPWMAPRISEPKAALFLVAAIFTATTPWRFRHLASASLAAAAFLIKEPMVVAISLVLALHSESSHLADSGKRVRRVLLPHLLLFVVALCTYGLVLGAGEKRADYVFLNSERLPLWEFISMYWEAIKSLWIKKTGWLFLIPIAIIHADAWRCSRGRGRSWFQQSGWVICVSAAVIAVLGHGAIYYMTNRYVAENRYVIPANLYFIILLALVLAPAIRLSSKWGCAVAWSAAVAVVAYSGFYGLPLTSERRVLTIIFVVIVTLAFLLVVCAAPRARQQGWVAFVTGIALSPIAASQVDAILQSAAATRVDQQSWQRFVNDVSALPSRANVQLIFTDPYMIETAWGLQTELSLRGRSDLNVWLKVTDTSAYGTTSGLLRDANESFNLGRRLDGNGHAIQVAANRAGNQRSVSPPPQSVEKMLLGAVSSPQAFFLERYVAGRVGYLQYSLTN